MDMNAIYCIGMILIFLLVMVTVGFLQKSKKSRKNSFPQYQKKYLLTKNEYSFFQKLKPLAKKNNLTILCKIRLADLIEPIASYDKKDWYAAFNKIKSKHIDFALVDENMHVVMLIELEDQSHLKSDRMERDEFVNAALTQAGYPLLCVYNNADAIPSIQTMLLKKD
jgi:hypothetical protein